MRKKLTSGPGADNYDLGRQAIPEAECSWKEESLIAVDGAVFDGVL